MAVVFWVKFFCLAQILFQTKTILGKLFNYAEVWVPEKHLIYPEILAREDHVVGGNFVRGLTFILKDQIVTFYHLYESLSKTHRYIPNLTNGILANKSKSFIKSKDSSKRKRRKTKDPTHFPSLLPKGMSQHIHPDPTARRPGARTRGACSPASQLPGLEVRSPASAPAGSRGRRAQGKGWGWLAETRF